MLSLLRSQRHPSVPSLTSPLSCLVIALLGFVSGEEEKWVSSALMAVSARSAWRRVGCVPGPVLSGCSVGAAHSVLMAPCLLRKDPEVESSVMAPVGRRWAQLQTQTFGSRAVLSRTSQRRLTGVDLPPFRWPPFLSSTIPALFHVVLLFFCITCLKWSMKGAFRIRKLTYSVKIGRVGDDSEASRGEHLWVPQKVHLAQCRVFRDLGLGRGIWKEC